MNEQLPSHWPHYSQDELDLARDVLVSGKVNYWTGEEGRHFEREFAQFVGTNYAIVLANGTLALELALVALNLQPGDEVVVTPRSFIASASCVAMHGMKPVFADVDLDSQNVTAESIERVLTPRTKMILPVHLAGWPCDMEPIMQLAKDRQLFVVEDCAQAHGATYKGKSVGSFGEIAAWSFCQDKIMSTAGEGGMITLNDESLWNKAWSYKDHGKSYEAVYHKEHPIGFRWLCETFGSNWRLPELQSAIGRKQLKKLPEWARLRRRNAQILIDRFAELPALRIPVPSAESEHAYYKFFVFVRPECLKEDWNRNRIMETISERRVFCQSGGCAEIYLEEAFRKAGYGLEKRLPKAQELGETSLMFQVHPTLEEEQMHRVADVVVQVVKEATR